MLIRIGFGFSILFVGLVHYMTLEGFVAMTSEDLGALEIVGTVWAYVLPALMIIGGALFVIGMYKHIAAWAAGLALISIPVGMLLKPVLSGIPLSGVMTMANNAFLWLIIYYIVVKTSCCEECS